MSRRITRSTPTRMIPKELRKYPPQLFQIPDLILGALDLGFGFGMLDQMRGRPASLLGVVAVEVGIV